MSSVSVCSRREPSKIAQGKRSAALGKRQTEGIRPGGADRTLAPRIAESNDGAGLSHRPPGRESLGRTLPQGFTPGYFRLFPPGRTALNASLFPHLLLRQINTNNVRVPHSRHVFVFVAGWPRILLRACPGCCWLCPRIGLSCSLGAVFLFFHSLESFCFCCCFFVRPPSAACWLFPL